MPEDKEGSAEEMQRMIREEIVAKYRKPKAEKKEAAAPIVEKEIEIAAPPQEAELPAPEPELPAPKAESPTEFKFGDKVFTWDAHTGEMNRQVAHYIKSKTEEGGLTIYTLTDGLEYAENLLEKAPDDARAVSAPPTGPEITKAPEAKEQTPEAATIEQTVAEAAKDFFEEKTRDLNLSEEERKQWREMYETIVNNKGGFEKIADLTINRIKNNKVKTALGWGTTLLASGGASAGFRWAMRRGLETWTSLGTLSTGMVVGSLVGAGIRGVSEYYKARKEVYSATNWAKELEGKEPVDLAARYDALKKAIAEQKVKGNEQAAFDLVMKLRDTGTALAQNGGPEQIIAQRRADDEITDFTGEREKLYKDMLAARRKQVRSKTVKGIAWGAAIGLLGGTIGALAHDYFTGAAKLEDLKGSRDLPKRLIFDHIRERAIAARAETAQRSFAHLMGQLANQNFVEHAQKGEGLTNVARNFIHDYLTQDNRIRLSREQLVYAEDYLQRQIEHSGNIVKLGERFDIRGQSILEALNAAKNLSAEQLENLKQNEIGKIAEKTWEKILDYNQTFETANQFSKQFQKQALAQGQAAFDKAWADAGASLEQVRKAAREAAEAAATAEHRNRIMEKVIRVLGITEIGGAIGYGAYQGLKKGYDWLNSPRQPRQPKPEEKTSVLGLEEEPQTSPPAPAPELAQPPEPAPRPAPEAPKPAESVPLEEGKKGLLSRFPFSKESRAARKRRREADPLVLLLRERGVKPKLIKTLNYGLPKPKDIGKEKATIEKFSNYSDYRARLDSLSPYLRARALHYTDTGPLGSGALWADQGSPKRDDPIYEQIRLGRFEDKFIGKTEITPKTNKDLAKLEDVLDANYDIEFSRDWGVDDDANYYAAEKLNEVLNKIPKEKLKDTNFQPDLKNEVAEDGNIHFNPDSNPAELQKFLESEALDTANNIREKEDQARAIFRDLEDKNDIDVYWQVYGEKLLGAAQRLKEALATISNPLEGLEIRFIKDADSYRVKDEVNLIWNMTSEEMRAEISKFLESKNKEGNPNQNA